VLAKELGVTAKEVLGWLAEHGEHAKSASSTVEAPVARRLREHYTGTRADARSSVRVKPGPPAPGPVTKSPVKTPVQPPDRFSASPRNLTPAELDSIRRRFRQAAQSGVQSRKEIRALCLEYQEQFGIPWYKVQGVVKQDRIDNHAAYMTERPQRNAVAPVESPPGRAAAGAAALATADTRAVSNLRPRTGSLPPAIDVATDSVVDLIMNLDADQQDRAAVRECVAAFGPQSDGGWGYLAWRYTAAHRSSKPELASGTARDDLAIMAQVTNAQRQIIEQITAGQPGILEQPALAKRRLETEFADLNDDDYLGRSAADQLRRVRVDHRFLRRALVLMIANPDCDDVLWDMLDRIRPPTPEHIVMTSTQLEWEIARFDELIADVSTLLSASDEAFEHFCRRAHGDVAALQAGQFDFLRRFHDIGATVQAPRRTFDELPFTVLPRGERLEAFRAGLRSAGYYHGHRTDPLRVDVLNEIEAHFGADRCTWYEGNSSSSPFNNQYVVLTIKAANGSGEHAVAVSPLAGKHATYVVRGDCVEANWRTVLAQSKPDALEHGARRHPFVGPEPYDAMRDRVIRDLECSRPEYLKMIGVEQR